MLSTRIFRLFLSSTFSDFVAEREALRTRVFPQLEKLCRDHGAVFQAVDLRWGITEEAQREQDTMRICLQEIRRCQQLSPRPNFAVLLGNRYGWEPPPARIPIDHWRRLLAAASPAERKIIRAGYRGPDRNAMPPVYHIQDRQDGWELSESRERILRDALRSCVAKADFPESEKVAYFASATHQEIILGALLDHDENGEVLHPERHVHVYVRSLDGMPRDQSASEFLDWDASRGEPVAGAAARLHALEQQLRKRLGGHVHDLHTHWDRHGRGGAVDEAYLDALCERFLADQTALIQAELGALARPDAAVERQSAHEEFGAARCRVFAGRKRLLKTIAAATSSRVGKAAQRPLVLVGGGGSGKSALLARAAQEKRRECQGTASVIIERYIGGVPGTESLMVTLSDLIADMATAYDQPEPPRPESTQQMTEAFQQALQYATAERPLYLYLDALDQLSSADGAWVLDWLPQQLPPYAKVVVTVRSGTSVESAARGRFGRRVLQMPPMSASEGRAMLTGLLADKRSAWFNAGIAPTTGRALTRDQKKVVLDGFAQSLGSPLWLKLAYEEASTWASWESPTLPTTVPQLIENFIDRRLLERDNHPRVFTERALAYITAGRFGLAEHELARALGGDAEVRAEFRSAERTQRKWQDPKLLPPILWSRLFFDLQAYLAMASVDGALVMRWFHREFGEALKARYLAAPSDRARVHGALADRFEAEEREQRPDSTDDTDLFRATDASGTPSSAALRRVMEQPWQLAAAGRNDDLRALLTDFGFCMGKCAANRAADLVADMTAMARGCESSRSVEAWRRFFIRRAHMLRRGDAKWPSHKILLQLGIEEADDAPITKAAEAWLERGACDWVWLRSHDRPASTPEEHLLFTMEGHTTPVKGVEVLSDGRILSWSEEATLRLWDGETGACLSVMEGHTGAVDGVKVLSDDRILSWSDGDATLRLWSGETGVGLVTMAGRYSRVIGTELIPASRMNIFGWYRRPSVAGAEVLPDGRILSWSEELRLWDSETGMSLMVMEGHTDWVSDVEVLSNGRILSWSRDTTLRLWDAETGCCFAVMKGHANSVIGAKVLSDGRILSWSDDTTLRFWDGETGLCLAVMEGHTDSVGGAEVLSDGRILSWSDDTTLRLWDGVTGTCLAVMEGHSSPIGGSAVLSDDRIVSWGRKIFSGTKNYQFGDTTLRLWDGATGTCLAVMEGHSSGVLGAKALPDGRMLSWARDCTARIWRIPSVALQVQVQSHQAFIRWIKMLSRRRILSCSLDDTLCLWDGDTGSFLAVMSGHTDQVSDVKVLSGCRLLTWSKDTTLRIWDSETGSSLAVMEGHAEWVSDVDVLFDGRILSWSDDATLRLWDGETGLCLAVMEGHSGSVDRARFLPNGRILSWSYDDTPRVWDAETGICLGTMEGKFVEALSDGRILSSSYDARLRLWDGETGVCLSVMAGHRGPVSGAKVLPDGHILSWSDDTTLRFWDGETGLCLAVMEGHTDSVGGAEVLSDGRILSWSDDTTLRLWDGNTGRCLAVMKGHADWVIGAKVLSDGRILSWSEDATLRLWSDEAGAGLAVMEGHTLPIDGLKVLSDGCILSWSKDATLRLWSGQTGVSLAVMEGHTRAIDGVKVLTDGRILSWSKDATLRLWSGQAGVSLAVMEGHTRAIDGVKVLTDGRILSWSSDTTLRLWAGKTGACLVVMEGHTGPVDGVEVLADGRILSWSKDTTLRLWDGEAATSLAVMEGHADYVGGVEVLSDGRILSWSSDTTLCLWDAETGARLAVMGGHSRPVSGAKILPDGHILSWSIDATMRLWEGKTGVCLRVMAGHFFEALSDGRVLSWSSGRRLRLWDSETGACLAVMEGHTGAVSGARVLSDGRILTWASDSTLRLWHGETGVCLAVMDGHADWVEHAEVLSDGRILSRANDNTLRLWHGETGVCLATMEGHTDSIHGAKVLSNGCILSWSGRAQSVSRSMRVSGDGTLRFWDAKTGAPLAVLDGCVYDGSEDSPRKSETLPEGQILSTSADGTVRLWDSESGVCLAVVKGHTHWCTRIEFLPDGGLLSSSFDGTLRLWDRQAERPTEALPDSRDENLRDTIAMPRRGIPAGAIDGDAKPRRDLEEDGDMDTAGAAWPFRQIARWDAEDPRVYGATSAFVVAMAGRRLHFLQLFKGATPVRL